MDLIWILSILCAAVSTASYIDSGYSQTTRSLTHNPIFIATRELPVITTRSINKEDELSLSDHRTSKNSYRGTKDIERSENDAEISPSKLERRGKNGRESKKRKQSAGNRSAPQLQHQRSGSSYQLSNSASANSLGVEDKGVSKPIPKRHSDKQLKSDRLSELTGSLGAKSLGDLRRLDPGRGSSESLFSWANPQGNFGSGPSTTTHQTVRGFSPPALRHQQALGGAFHSTAGFANYRHLNSGFGSASALNTLPEKAPLGGFPRSPLSPQRPNSKASSESGSRMSIELGEEVQGPPKMQRLGGVADLTMMNAMPYLRQRMQYRDRSPSSSDWGTSSRDRSSDKSGSVLSP